MLWILCIMLHLYLFRKGKSLIDQNIIMNKVFSVWEKDLYEQTFDFIIIGAGLTGLSTAIHLKKAMPQKEILLLEKGVIPYGASTKNAGFATFGSIGELEDDRKIMSLDEIVETVKMRYNGLKLLRSLVPDELMNYNPSGSIEFFEDEASFNEAYAQMEFWNEQFKDFVGPSVFNLIDRNLPGFYPKAIDNVYEGMLNPALAVRHLWASAQNLGAHIMCGTELQSYEIKNDTVHLRTNIDLKLKAKKMIFCTNAFTKTLLPDLDLIPARNQVLITKPLDVNPLKSCYHYNKGYVYFRAVGDRILLGGARNISTMESIAEYGNTAEIQDHLTKFLKERIAPEAEIDHWWSGIIATGSAKNPLIHKMNDHISFGLRLSGIGVAIGTLVGKKVAEMHIE